MKRIVALIIVATVFLTGCGMEDLLTLIDSSAQQSDGGYAHNVPTGLYTCETDANGVFYDTQEMTAFELLDDYTYNMNLDLGEGLTRISGDYSELGENGVYTIILKGSDINYEFEYVENNSELKALNDIGAVPQGSLFLLWQEEGGGTSNDPQGDTQEQPQEDTPQEEPTQEDTPQEGQPQEEYDGPEGLNPPLRPKNGSLYDEIDGMIDDPEYIWERIYSDPAPEIGDADMVAELLQGIHDGDLEVDYMTANNNGTYTVVGGYWNTPDELYAFIESRAGANITHTDESREAAYDFFVNNGIKGLSGTSGFIANFGFAGIVRMKSNPIYYYENNTIRLGYEVIAGSQTPDLVKNFGLSPSENALKLAEYINTTDKPLSYIEPNSHMIILYGEYTPENGSPFKELTILKATTTANSYIEGQSEPIPMSFYGSTIQLDQSGFSTVIKSSFDTMLIKGF